jgi:integrase/recombinase XerD
VVAGELLDRARRELLTLAELGKREQLLAAAWLASLRSARTRRAYFTDLRAWLGWLTERGVAGPGRPAGARGPVGGQLERSTEAASVRRRLLSALSSFYRYCATHDVVEWVLTAGVLRPVVDADYTHHRRAGPCRRPRPASPPQTPTPDRRRCAARR